jgi:hypothetical protein
MGKLFKERLVLPTDGMSESSIAARKKIIGAGARSFIEEENLNFTPTQHKRFLHTLYQYFWEIEGLSEADVVEYLYEVYDFQSEDDPENLISSLIVAADKPLKYRSEKSWLFAFILVIISLVIYLQLLPAKPISVDQSLHLKQLVSEISTCTNFSHMKIWNEVKSLDSISSIGESTSYKRFNEEQYLIALDWLIDYKERCTHEKNP